MNRALVLLAVSVARACWAADSDGVVGIHVKTDFRVVSSVVPDSPAALAGVRAGDRIIAVDGYPTAKLKAEDFVARASGAPGSEMELQIQHPGSERLLHIRLKRIPRSMSPPSQDPSGSPSRIPAGFDAHQVRNDTCRPNQHGS